VLLRAAVCCVQVFRGTWTNIDIAAKQYLAENDDDAPPSAQGPGAKAGPPQPNNAAAERARVSQLGGPSPAPPAWLLGCVKLSQI